MASDTYLVHFDIGYSPGWSCSAVLCDLCPDTEPVALLDYTDNLQDIVSAIDTHWSTTHE